MLRAQPWLLFDMDCWSLEPVVGRAALFVVPAGIFCQSSADRGANWSIGTVVRKKYTVFCFPNARALFFNTISHSIGYAKIADRLIKLQILIKIKKK